MWTRMILSTEQRCQLGVKVGKAYHLAYAHREKEWWTVPIDVSTPTGSTNPLDLVKSTKFEDLHHAFFSILLFFSAVFKLAV
jgi:hypothetical protein